MPWDYVSHDDALLLSLQLPVCSFRLHRVREWNETWIKYKEWPRFAHTTHSPVISPGYMDVLPTGGWWFSILRQSFAEVVLRGITNAFRSSRALTLRLYLLYLPLFSFSICLSTLSFLPWFFRAYLFRAASGEIVYKRRDNVVERQFLLNVWEILTSHKQSFILIDPSG